MLEIWNDYPLYTVGQKSGLKGSVEDSPKLHFGTWIGAKVSVIGISTSIMGQKSGQNPSVVYSKSYTIGQELRQIASVVDF